MPVWRNGRRDGLKIRCWQQRVGSSPTTGTIDRPYSTVLLWGFDYYITASINLKFIQEVGVMDIWEKLYSKAKECYCPKDVSPFVYAHHVVCALESENGEVYTGFCIESCSGVLNLFAERVAVLNMYVNSGQTKIKRLIVFCNDSPHSGSIVIPCGACREFLYQINEKNESTQIMVDYATKETVTLKDLMPNWWGKERYTKTKSNV